MAFRVTTREAYSRSINLASRVKDYADSTASALRAGDVSANLLVEAFSILLNYRQNFQSIRNTSGIANFAKAQQGDQNYDVIAEFDAMIAAINTALQWIRTNIPKAGGGYILTQQLTTEGVVTRTFSTAETADLATHFDSISSSIS